MVVRGCVFTVDRVVVRTELFAVVPVREVVERTPEVVVLTPDVAVAELRPEVVVREPVERTLAVERPVRLLPTTVYVLLRVAVVRPLVAAVAVERRAVVAAVRVADVAVLLLPL